MMTFSSPHIVYWPIELQQKEQLKGHLELETRRLPSTTEQEGRQQKGSLWTNMKLLNIDVTWYWFQWRRGAVSHSNSSFLKYRYVLIRSEALSWYDVDSIVSYNMQIRSLRWLYLLGTSSLQKSTEILCGELWPEWLRIYTDIEL